MNDSLKGQVALITGGGKGIGLGIAKALAARGVRLVLTGRDRGALETALTSIGGEGLAITMDVRDEGSVERGVQQASAWGGGINIVVNNSGIGVLETPLMNTSHSVWRDVIETNLTGAFLVTQASWPLLVAAKGQLLNVSSIAGTQGFNGASAYCASKHGLNGFTEVLKKEGAEVGVRVLAICPGSVDTDIWDAKWASKEHRARMMTTDQLGEIAAQMLSTPRNIDLNSWIVVNATSPWSA
jgi:NAD(P)-dependent dehydrogenase (short-subunit alcohol dehydrogenase family)